MLKIFKDLKPFFEDVYREVSVREYSRQMGISPPTASKQLKEFEKEGILISNNLGIYLFFRLNKENPLVLQLSRLYWYSLLHPLTKKLHEQISFGKIILFGSLSKAENKIDSDADIYLESKSRTINPEEIEKILKRKVQLHFADSMKNKNLKENIEKGVIIR